MLTYAEKVKSGQKLVQLWLDTDKWNQIKLAAESVQEPLTAWIRRAIFASLRKWEIPEVSLKAQGSSFFCNHPACHRLARLCKAPVEHKTQGEWTEML